MLRRTKPESDRVTDSSLIRSRLVPTLNSRQHLRFRFGRAKSLCVAAIRLPGTAAPRSASAAERNAEPERPRSDPMNIQPKKTEPLILSGRDVTAVLGPTNTGKTHLAIERMVAHESGVIGLPLRLLAREVYARVCEKVGAHKVALITGEEKILPPGARYSVCTVEAMPRETDAAFVAIDEVQLAGDFERGHIFTDRILHLRGRQETLLLGAATMRGILERLLQGISVVTRPRLSHLAYAGQKKLTRLPQPLGDRRLLGRRGLCHRRTGPPPARRRRGRARRARRRAPAMRRSRSTSRATSTISIATDAIGMGLNLDLDHVAFAQNRKFDGYQYPRPVGRRTRPDRRPRRPASARRHVRRHRPGRSARRRTGREDRRPRFRSGEGAAVAHRRLRLFQPRCAEALDRDAGARRGADAGAARRRRAGAGTSVARSRHPRSRHEAASASRCSGRSARCPTTARSRRRSMPT